MRARDVLRRISGSRARTAGSLLQGIRGNGKLLFGSARSIVERGTGARTAPNGVGKLLLAKLAGGSRFRLGFTAPPDASAR